MMITLNIKGVNKVMKDKLPDFNFISKKVYISLL
jgi:hypothetical protein